MCKVFHLVKIGIDERDLVALLDPHFVQPVGRCDSGKMNRNLVAISFDARSGLLFRSIREVIDVAHLDGLDNLAIDNDEVMRF